ncbi:MAG TPA: helix-turn-helix domain-containing protein [Gemmatimonadaceae bacterium]|nr:helix-turn-helix domain-containing protein [Gemmatimonadaceae bacterium]
MLEHPAPAPLPPTILVYAPRERTRAMARETFPRRRWRLVVRRDVDDFARAFREELIDAAIVDLGAAQEENWRAAGFAREFPSVPFFALTTLRASDGPTLAQCAALEFADVLVEDVDEDAIRELVLRQSYTTRFARALATPPASLGLATTLQLNAWQFVVQHAGRPVRTAELASALNVTREHLSRTFSADGAPNLKRVIDLVRLTAAAELSKNPGYDVRDVARVLGFASSSHLSSTAQRIAGTRPASLARLRAVDLIERFNRGHARSRG